MIRGRPFFYPVMASLGLYILFLSVEGGQSRVKLQSPVSSVFSQSVSVMFCHMSAIRGIYVRCGQQVRSGLRLLD